MSVQGIPDGLLPLEHTTLDFFHDSDSVVNVFLPLFFFLQVSSSRANHTILKNILFYIIYYNQTSQADSMYQVEDGNSIVYVEWNILEKVLEWDLGAESPAHSCVDVLLCDLKPISSPLWTSFSSFHMRRDHIRWSLRRLLIIIPINYAIWYKEREGLLWKDLSLPNRSNTEPDV